MSSACRLSLATGTILLLAACAQAPDAAVPTASMGTGSATLSWEPPRRNLDGSPIKNLAGYFIYYGKDPDKLNSTIKIADPYVTTYTVDRLGPGTYYFSVVAFTDTGIKGSVSPTVSKTIR